MSEGVIYIFTITLLVALGGLAFWIVRQSMGIDGINLFQSRPKRLGVVEVTSVDGRRRLLLIRRDNVEHLIMTGGPVDMVVETGIPPRAGLANGLGTALSHASQESAEERHTFNSPEIPLILQRDQTN